MKKIISFLVWCIVGLTTATAQISSYSFAYTSGTYSEISGGTIVYAGAAQGAESLRLENYAFVPGDTLISEIATVTGYPIGFNFNLGEQTFTHFAISPNGFIYLGGESFTVDATEVSNGTNASYPEMGTKVPILSDDNRFTTGATNVLGFSRTDADRTGDVMNDVSATTADADTEISYLLSGSDENQVLTVQFKKIILSTANSQNAVNIQIRLYKDGNKVELIFKDFATFNDITWAEIGLKGDALGNTKYLSIFQDSNWSTATAGVTGIVSLRNTICDNGATFTFTPPPTCVAPASQPTDLQLTPASSSISGSFTATEADKYLVLVGKDIAMVGTKDRPVDGVTYNVGDGINNNKLTVVAYSSGTTFNVTGLEGSSKYSFYIYAANSECLFGSPKYNRTGALSGTINTLPDAPQLSVSENGFTSLKLTTQANNPVIVAVNQGQWAIDNNSNQLNDGVFGTPTLEMNVGDLLNGGGKIVYKGPASNTIEVAGLEPNKLINFAAWSYDETQGTVSSDFAKFNVTTWGESPYALDFGQYAAYDIPVEWEQECLPPLQEGSYFKLTQNSTTRRGNLLEARIETASPSAPVYASIATQYLKLATGNSRLVLSGKLTHTTNTRPFTTTGYNEWEANDSIVFLVKKFGETDYAPIYTIKADNAATFFPDASAAGAYSNSTIPIEGFAGDTVKVKIAWTTHKAGTLLWDITKFIIEETPDYEAPINLTVDPASIIGGQAKITWEKHATGTESAWEVRYRPLNGEWSTPVETSETNYLFTTLPTDASVEVTVRAITGLNTYSPWTFPFLSFKTGRGLPYSENFDDYDLTTFAANSGWTLSSTTMILWDSSTLRFRMYQRPAPATALALLPKLDFGDGSANYQLTFDLSTLGAIGATDSLYVIDKTAEEEIILEKYPSTVSGSYTIALEGFAGIKQLGFKVVENTRNTSAYFVLDNVGILPTCPVAVSNAQATGVTTEEAKVSWESEAGEWLVFIRKAGETTKEYAVKTEKEVSFTGLEEATAYEAGITTVCAPGDTAQVTIVRFTTLTTIPCVQVSNIEATSTTGSVTLAWESEASKFNVKFRQTGNETWTERVVEGAKTTTFTGLTHNTNYEYSIQTVCSGAEGDVSDYTAAATVKTVEITCFAPTNLVADPLVYNSATLSWEGNATKYELSWAQTGNEWTVVIIESKSYPLSALTPATNYEAKVRAICAEGDTSVYSPVYTFATPATPVCPIPTNLTVSSVNDRSALLSWTADEANTSWSLRYRAGNDEIWTDISELTAKSYELTGLTANTVYLWRVKAYCAETANESAYAAQEEFSTNQTGLASIDNTLKVNVSNRIVSVLNPAGAYIENIRLYAVDGSLLQDFSVRSSDNVLIPTSISQKIAIVKVIGNDTQATFKVVVK